MHTMFSVAVKNSKKQCDRFKTLLTFNCFSVQKNNTFNLWWLYA